MSEIDLKWQIDSKHLPLSERHLKIYRLLHKRSKERINAYPNLINPSTFNDYINWCKLFDQCEEAVIACDKARLREYASSFGLESHVLEQISVTSNLASIDPDRLTYPCVIKCNHDSGSAQFVSSPKQVIGLHQYFRERLSRTYGVVGGEWQYSMMKPKVVIEHNFNPGGKPLPDYKFHCVSGEAFFCQHITDRGQATKEINVDLNGKDLGFLFDENFSKSNSFNKPAQYEEMINIANLLSKPFKYARIDLYLINDKVFVGEVTLHPRGGYYTGQGQIDVGKMMNFDTSSYKQPIWES